MIGDRIHTHVSLLRQPITKLKVKVLQSSSSLFYPNFVWNQIVSKKIYFRLLRIWERKPTFFLTKSNIFGFVKFSKSSTKWVIGTWFWALVYLLYWTAFFPSTTTNPVQILLKFDIIFWLNIWRETKWLWCTCSFGGQHYSLQVQQFEFQSCWSLTLYSGLNLGSNNYL